MLWTDKYGPKPDVEVLTTHLDTGHLGWGWKDGSAVQSEVGNKAGCLLPMLPSRFKSQGGTKKQATTKGCRKSPSALQSIKPGSRYESHGMLKAWNRWVDWAIKLLAKQTEAGLLAWNSVSKENRLRKTQVSEEWPRIITVHICSLQGLLQL